ncbi:MAG TPA: DUF493 domain-containing protein [Thermoguttaceae bacterium]|nr:DUF493 domain-containing protein [Thermoguttaceae bacterium]
MLRPDQLLERATMQQKPICGKPEVDYPCQWVFKVIGTDEPALRRAIHDTIADRAHQLNMSNRSRGGKYCSLKLSIQVEDEADRDTIFEALRDHEHVTTLL